MTEHLVNVTYKFGGFWSIVKKEDKRKYEGGKQKTIKLDRADLNLDVLTKEVERICPWIQGYCYELHYYILGTSPKEYKLLTTDCDEMEFARQSMETGRAEVIVSLENEQEIVSNKQLLQHRGPTFDVVESTFNQSETYDGGQSSSGVVDVGVISVGSRFSNSLSFKLFLHSEITTKKITKIHKCGRCGLAGHHRSSCKNPLSDSTEVMAEFAPSSCVFQRHKLPIRRDATRSNC